MGVVLRPTQQDLRRWRDAAERWPDAWIGDVVLVLIREVERLKDEVRELRREETG